MALTASKLRQNIYRILDQILESGKSVEIVRKGKILRIEPPQKPDKFKNLKKRKLFNCDPDDLVHIDWSDNWRIDDIS